MSCNQHDHHQHVHGPDCGHTAVKHDGHVCYLHEGHLHRPHGDHVDECRIAVDASNPAGCTSGRNCTGHDPGHQHGPGCGHEAIPHGDHVDYLVAGQLHHPCGDHCDNHGAIALG